MRTSAVVAALLLATAWGALPGEYEAKPDGALSLQAAFEKAVAASFGPAPLRQNANEAVWKAGDILNNAQGAVCFRIRIPKQDKPPQQPFPLMSLSGTQAGEWTLLVNEAPEPKPSGKPKPPDQLPEPVAGPLDDGGAVGGASVPRDLDDKEKRDPVSQFTCEVRTRIFAEGNIAGKTAATAKVFEWGQWHHVVWTWRSVHHFIYIDGKLRGTSLQVSRMQPIASAEAFFRVLLGKAELADLRLYKRALDPPDAVALSAARPDRHLPPFPALRVWADWGPATGRAVVYLDAADPSFAECEFQCVEAKSGRVLHRWPMHDFPSGLGERSVALTEPHQIPAGAYRFEAVALNGDAKPVARAQSADWTCRDAALPWLGTRVGLPDKPALLPPYTAVEAKGDSVRTLLRDQTIDRTGLPKSILAGGAELLAAPMRLEALVGGKPVTFSDGPGLRGAVSKGAFAVTWATTRTPEGHELTVEGRTEFDGLTTFDVVLVPAGTPIVDRVGLVIPFRPEVMQHFHCVASGFINRFMAVEKDREGRFRARNICWDTYSPKEPKRREGVIYDADDVHHMAEVDRFRFVPFVHVGNNQRGLAWFAENDQGWVHDPGKVPPMEIVATEKEMALRLNIVAKPTTITEKESLSFRFYLLANPFKPMPKDWRSWVVGDYRKDTEFAKKAPYRFWWHWNEYAKSFVPYPGGVQGKTYQDWVGKFKGDDLIHCPFINFGVPADSGLYGPPFFDEMAVLPYSWKLHNSRPHQDYVAYWLDKCAKEIGIKGVYVDEPYCEPYSYNVLASDAPYIRADGTRAVGYRWLEARDYFRRIKQTFHDLGLPHSLWVHTTNYKVSPALTFVDISMDGEHPMIWVPSFQDCHVFYNAERSRGYISGIPFGWVGTQMFHGNTEPKAFPGLWVKSRTYLAVTLPNQVLPQTCGIPDELDRIHNLWSWFGIGEEGVDEWPDAGQGRPAHSIQPEGAQLAGVANRKKGQALLYATAPWKGSRIELPDGFKGLDLGKPHIHAWNAETGASLVVDGKTLADLSMPNDVAVVVARGAGTPQASRSEGMLLGVSFDNGIEPDFGGGMLPASGAGDVSGKALALGFDKPAVGYPVVPSWVQGSVGFDLTVRSVSRTPLRLLALQHHLDLTLSAAQSGEERGLLLVANEVVPQEKLPYQSGKLPTQKREAFVRVPIGERGRVALVWRSGQYDLYWSGKRLGGISAPAAPRLRDAVAPAFGIWIGDGSGTKEQAEAVVDSLLVYDWALRPEDLAGRGPMVPAKRPPRGEGFDIRAWGEKLGELAVGIHLAEFKDWEKVTSVKFTVFDAKAPAAPLGTAELTPWLGTGATRLTLAVPKAPGPALGEPKGGDALTDLELERDLIIQADLFHNKDLLTTRKAPVRLGGSEPRPAPALP
ncbi:MAG TPA: DUF6067 family protein [Planctomycetota bacterium]|nr:DUF6067 family protein [Planctomycetota bacterium]